MPEINLAEETEYDFEDISSEEWREYDFSGVRVRIENPTYLAVSENGHRILDEQGISHYVGFDGFYVKWKSGEDAPHFVK